MGKSVALSTLTHQVKIGDIFLIFHKKIKLDI